MGQNNLHRPNLSWHVRFIMSHNNGCKRVIKNHVDDSGLNCPRHPEWIDSFEFIAMHLWAIKSQPLKVQDELFNLCGHLRLTIPTIIHVYVIIFRFCKQWQLKFMCVHFYLSKHAIVRSNPRRTNFTTLFICYQPFHSNYINESASHEFFRPNLLVRENKQGHSLEY